MSSCSGPNGEAYHRGFEAGMRWARDHIARKYGVTAPAKEETT